MINIFYHFSYTKKKRILFTKQLKYSKLVEPFFYFSYRLSMPVSSNLLFSGPEKRFNNLIKTFNKKDYSYQKKTYQNTYIVQFDSFGENILNKLINLEDFKNQKIIIGPLYSLEQQNRLSGYVKKYRNIKIMVASKTNQVILIDKMNLGLHKDDVIICPSGVISEEQLTKNSLITTRKDKCLIYFKNRSQKDLNKVESFLETKDIDYEIFAYGEYKNKALINAAKNYKFGICLDRTESQGFGIQEMMSSNLPLFVWEDPKLNTSAISKYYKTQNITGTAVPYWSNDCGVRVNSYEDFENYFDNFYNNIESFSPSKLIKENLTYEIVEKNLNNIFETSF